MPPLGSQARTTVRGEKNPHVGFDDPLENRAWAVWYAVRMGKARVSGTPSKGPEDRGLQDVDGFLVEVNLTTKMKELWSQLRQTESASQEAFKSEIRTYLRSSGNAVCLRSPGIGSGDHGQPLWWIRETWNDVKAVGIFRQTELTPRERRLTPQEVGEDRPAAPVEVRKHVQDDARRTVVVSNRDRVLELLRNRTEPVYQREIVHTLGVNTIDVGRVLRTLIGDGLAFRRLEKSSERPPELSGRYRYLYSIKNPVPPRTEPFTPRSLALDWVASFAPGEARRFGWLPPEDKTELAVMVESGLVEYTEDGHSVRLAKEAPAAAPAAPAIAASLSAEELEWEVSIPELSPETPEDTRVAMGGKSDAELAAERPVRDRLGSVMSALSELIEAQVQAGTLELRKQIEEERTARQRLESALIAARAEASEQRQLAERRARALRELTE